MILTNEKTKIQFLSMLVLSLILFIQPAMAAEIFGPAHITASTAIPNSGAGFTIDQISDGIINPPVWFNGFAAVPGIVGTIRLDLTTSADLHDFILWNDINVLAEGIADFRLEFFDAGDIPLGTSEVFTGPVGSMDPVIYSFEQVMNVKRVDLVALTLNVNQRLEIREIGFNESNTVTATETSWTQLKALYR